jgi:hypothetical protein
MSGHMGKVNVVAFNEDATVLASGEPRQFIPDPLPILPQAHTTLLSDFGIFGEYT